MTNDNRDRARLAADKVFDAGNRSEDIRTALPEAGEARSIFLERLAVRAAMDLAEYQGENIESAPAAVVARLRSAYDQERSRTMTGEVDLTKPAPWLAAQGAFSGDKEFIAKLMRRCVTTPTARFTRYVADALGISMANVRRHFEASASLALAGVERKSSGKPVAPGVEDFATAVRSAEVPQELKDRWLAE